MDERSVVQFWFDEYGQMIYDAIDKALHKIKKEYKKNRITHERELEIIAWTNKVEIRSKEIPMFGSWSDIEGEVDITFDTEDPVNQEELYNLLYDIGSEYCEQGYEMSVEYSRPNVPRLALYW